MQNLPIPQSFTDGVYTAVVTAVELGVAVALVILAACIGYALVVKFSGAGPGSSARSGGFASTERSSLGQHRVGREVYKNR